MNSSRMAELRAILHTSKICFFSQEVRPYADTTLWRYSQ